ncbi:MAG: hypothetical protein AAF411_13340 [Myxococcota bacterium]
MTEELPLPDFDEDVPRRPAASPVDMPRWLPASPAPSNPLSAVQSAIADRNAAQDEPARAPLPPLREEVVYQDVPHPGFDARFNAALRPPLQSWGLLWLAGAGAAITLSLWSVHLAGISLFVFPLLGTSAAGLFGLLFGQTASAAMADEGGPLVVSWHLPTREEIGMLGLPVAFSFAAMVTPAVALREDSALLASAALVVFFSYWPIALLGVGVSGSVWTLFRPLLLAKTAWTTRRYYGRSLLLALLVGLPPLGAALFGRGFVALLGGIVAGPALAYLAAVIGYQMGCLPPTVPEPFRAFRR